MSIEQLPHPHTCILCRLSICLGHHRLHKSTHSTDQKEMERFFFLVCWMTVHTKICYFGTSKYSTPVVFNTSLKSMNFGGLRWCSRRWSLTSLSIYQARTILQTKFSTSLPPRTINLEMRDNCEPSDSQHMQT